MIEPLLIFAIAVAMFVALADVRYLRRYVYRYRGKYHGLLGRMFRAMAKAVGTVGGIAHSTTGARRLAAIAALHCLYVVGVPLKALGRWTL